MKLFHIGIAVAGLAAMAACTNTPAENAAANARAAADNRADAIETMAANTMGAAENRADALQSADPVQPVDVSQ